MPIVNGYATLAELKTELGITTATAAIDARLELAIETASRLVDIYCGRRFWVDASAVARIYRASDSTYLDVDGISTTTDLVVEGDYDADGTYEVTLVEGTDFRLEPENATADGLPYSRLVAIGSGRFPTYQYSSVRVTAIGGWPTGIPSPVKHATLTQASRLYKRKDAPFGISGSPEMQGELRLLAQLDPDVQVMLSPPYRKQWVVA